MGSLLEVRNLTVRYHVGDGASVRAVTGASFRIEAGEIVGVLGESGSGKSTLAASMLAMFPQNALTRLGAVLLRGTDLLKLKDKELRRIRGSDISLISQEPGSALHPTMKVGTQIGEVLRAHTDCNAAKREDDAINLLRSVFPSDAERVYRSYPHELSGGQRQRVAILQAIACKPSLLVADEPTASLDPLTQRDILGLLKQLRTELQLAILFITHTPELLAGFADRIFVMYAGELVETGKASAVLRSPLHPYTRALLACRPDLRVEPRERLLPVIPGGAPDLTGLLTGCPFEPRCAERFSVCRERAPAVTNASDGAEVRCFKFDPENRN